MRQHSEHAAVLTSPLTLSVFPTTFVGPSDYPVPTWISSLLEGQLISNLNATSPYSLACHRFQDQDMDIFWDVLPHRGQSMDLQMGEAEVEAPEQGG